MFASAKKKRRKFDFYEFGFHGDKYLLRLVHVVIRSCLYFIETGTNVGSTLAYVGRTYPAVKCLSCEPDTGAFNHAVKNTSELPNVSIYNEPSQDFILRLKRQYDHLFEKNTLFWLDSHGDGFNWPLKEEISFITTNFKSPYILIDDFKVPGLDIFGYDKYEDQECSFDYIKNALNPKLSYYLYYPTYTARTSKHHPLRGWGLIEYGHSRKLMVPNSRRDKVQHTNIKHLRRTHNDTDKWLIKENV